MNLCYIVRLGDADDYERYQNLDEVIEVFQDAFITEIFKNGNQGVTADGFEGNNYISLYRGDYDDDDLDLVEYISDRDVELINESLAYDIGDSDSA